MNAVESFFESYAREFEFYEAVARLCAQRCETMLKESGIMAIVSHRAKNPERVRGKLERRAAGQDFQTADDVRAFVNDLAGVRIALYFPGDRQRVENLIEENFVILPRGIKRFPEEGHEGPGDYTRGFPGYTATHFPVTLKPGQGVEDRFLHTPAEIQLASLLMHAWSEVEHDLIYKRFKGEVSPTEHALVDQLNGIVLVGEGILRLLQAAMEERLVQSESCFSDQYELAAYLFRSLRKSLDATDMPPMGGVETLLMFLREAGLDSVPKLAPILKRVNISKQTSSISTAVAQAIVAGDDEAKAAYARVWPTSNYPGDWEELVEVLLEGNDEAGVFDRVAVGKDPECYWYFVADEEAAAYLKDRPELVGNRDALWEYFQRLRLEQGRLCSGGVAMRKNR